MDHPNFLIQIDPSSSFLVCLNLFCVFDHQQVIVSHDLIGRLMLLAARSPWIAPVLTSLMGFEGSEFYLKVCTLLSFHWWGIMEDAQIHSSMQVWLRVSGLWHLLRAGVAGIDRGEVWVTVLPLWHGRARWRQASKWTIPSIYGLSRAQTNALVCF